MPNNKIKTKRKKALIAKVGHCENCGSIEDLTIDHILARGLGGRDTKDNWQVYCYKCNNKKSAKESELARARNTGLSLEEIRSVRQIGKFYSGLPLTAYETKHVVHILKHLMNGYKKRIYDNPIFINPKTPKPQREKWVKKRNTLSNSIHALMKELSRREVYIWWI